MRIGITKFETGKLFYITSHDITTFAVDKECGIVVFIGLTLIEVSEFRSLKFQKQKHF